MKANPQETPQKALQDKKIKRHNTIKVFGTHNIHSVRHFFSIIARHGLPTQGIQLITRGGYKSEILDSRHFKIAFETPQDTALAHRALTNAEKHALSRSKWRHTQGWEIRREPSPNRFALLAEAIAKGPGRDPTDMMSICCWNINTLRGKEASTLKFAKTHDIHIMALSETKCKDRKFHSVLKEHTWFGRPSCRTAGGVGFLVENSVLEGSRVTCHDGKTQDTIFLRITTQRCRSTLFMLVYGITSPSKQVSSKQWESFRRDLRRELKQCPADTDVVFLGDINARMGKAQNGVELEHLSSLGEVTRSVSGSEALAFLEEMELICLNDRDKDQKTPNYTYREIGKDGKSIIDVICVSKGMYRTEYSARVLHETLTGKENHFPVLAQLKWRRNLPRQRKQPKQRVWATQLFEKPERLATFQLATDEHLQRGRIDESTCPDEAATILEGSLKAAGNESIGKIQVGGRAHKSRIEKQITSKRKELGEFRKSHKDELARSSPTHCQEEKVLLTTIQEMGKKAAAKNNRRLSRKLRVQHSNGDIHGVVNTMKEFQSGCSSKNTAITMVRDSNGVSRTTTEDIHTVLREYWSVYFQNPSFKDEMEEIGLDELCTKPHSEVCDKKFTVQELEQVLKQLQPHKQQHDNRDDFAGENDASLDPFARDFRDNNVPQQQDNRESSRNTNHQATRLKGARGSFENRGASRNAHRQGGGGRRCNADRHAPHALPPRPLHTASNRSSVSGSGSGHGGRHGRCSNRRGTRGKPPPRGPNGAHKGPAAFGRNGGYSSGNDGRNAGRNAVHNGPAASSGRNGSRNGGHNGSRSGGHNGGRTGGRNGGRQRAASQTSYDRRSNKQNNEDWHGSPNNIDPFEKRNVPGWDDNPPREAASTSRSIRTRW